MLNIEHRLQPPVHLQTNGVIERSNDLVQGGVQQIRRTSVAQREATLANHVKTHDNLIVGRVRD